MGREAWREGSPRDVKEGKKGGKKGGKEENQSLRKKTGEGGKERKRAWKGRPGGRKLTRC